MYFNRPEFDRYARFHSWGSARETFDWEEMCDIDILLPSISIQRKYANVCAAMKLLKGFNEKMSDICPILIKGSLEKGKRSEG